MPWRLVSHMLRPGQIMQFHWEVSPSQADIVFTAEMHTQYYWIHAAL
jgi:hypothetical protein